MVDEEHGALGGEMVWMAVFEAVFVLETCGIGEAG
jgi:hypothetical protein